MKLRYYGIDRATSKIQYFGIGDRIYIGNYDDDSGEWQLDLWGGALPVVYFYNTYRIVDSNDNQILYSYEGKNYIADLDFKKLGTSSSYVWSVNNVKESPLTSLPVANSATDDSAEDDLAKATSSPLIPLLLVGAAYFIFFR